MKTGLKIEWKKQSYFEKKKKNYIIQQNKKGDKLFPIYNRNSKSAWIYYIINCCIQ